MSAAMNTVTFRAFPDYQSSREHIIIGTGDGHYLGTVYAWVGSLYWPVRDVSGKLVAHVRRQVGGLYAPEAAKSPAIQLAAQILMDCEVQS